MPRQGLALLQGLVVCGQCGRLSLVPKETVGSHSVGTNPGSISIPLARAGNETRPSP